jgi:hypothetical protein
MSDEESLEINFNDLPDHTEQINLMLAYLGKGPLPPPKPPVPVTSVYVGEGSPCDVLDDQRMIESMTDISELANMSHKELIAKCRRNLSASFYTSFASMPAVSVFDKAIPTFLCHFADPTGLSIEKPNGLSAARYCHWIGVWGRSYTAAVSKGDYELAAKCAALASYFLACLILGSRYCWEDIG